MNRKQLPILLLILFCCFSVSAFAKSFDELHVSGPCELTLVENPDSAGIIVLQPGQQQVAGLDVRSAGSALYVVLPPDALRDRLLKLTLYFNGPVTLIDTSGRAVVNTPAIKSENSLSLVSAGASVINIETLTAKNVNVSLSGSGVIDINGEAMASTINLSLTGSGKILADALAVARLSVTQRGSGKITLAGSARDCAVVGFGSGRVDLRRVVSASMNLKQYSTGQIFYPAGVHAVIDGKIENIHADKPYQPL